MHTVETQRLVLRPLAPSDLEELYAVLSDPQVVRYVGDGTPATREVAKAALLSFGRHWEHHGFGRWAVTLKETGGLIGYGGLRMLVDTPEVVYHLAVAHWGRGYATEVARASLRYGFEAHGFGRIVAIAKPENAGSIRVMEKVGMTFEGRANYYGMDVVQYSLSRASYSPDGSPYALRRV